MEKRDSLFGAQKLAGKIDRKNDGKANRRESDPSDRGYTQIFGWSRYG
jgi:hypothetical protein